MRLAWGGGGGVNATPRQQMSASLLLLHPPDLRRKISGTRKKLALEKKWHWKKSGTGFLTTSTSLPKNTNTTPDNLQKWLKWYRTAPPPWRMLATTRQKNVLHWVHRNLGFSCYCYLCTPKNHFYMCPFQWLNKMIWLCEKGAFGSISCHTLY